MNKSLGNDSRSHPNNCAVLLGITSIISQVLFLRELITLFYGNETAYAVILASWLFWVGVGSFVGTLLLRWVGKPGPVIRLIQGCLWPVLPATILVIRQMNLFLHIRTGEIVGMVPMALVSFLAVAPLTILLGILFVFICSLSDQTDGSVQKTSGISEIYFWEAAGSAVGGALFGLFLIPVIPAMMAAFILGGINGLTGLFLHKKRSGRYILSVYCAGALALYLLSGVITRLDDWTRVRQWQPLEVVARTDSIYGDITITKMGGEYSLYENGLFSFSTKDSLSSEESVHFSLLEHPDPRKVLLIGNGLGGGLREILKHPGSQVDYVELDPTVIRLSRQNLPAAYWAPLEDDRVEVFYTDARRFVKNTDTHYDVIIVNLSDPYTALLNRYYSLEFFREARRILNEGGLLSLSVSSSENYLNEEQREFLRSIHTTLRRVFPDVQSIPGDINIFLASSRPGLLTLRHDLLVRRLKERGIQTQYVREYYLPYKLSPDRVGSIQAVLKEYGVVNTDMRPIAYLYDIVLWSTHFNAGFKNFIDKVRGLQPLHLLILPLLIGLIGLVRKKSSPTFPITCSILTTGFSEIIFQVIIILAFQALYGYAYYKIGMIMASFMGGLCGGGLVAQRLLLKPDQEILRWYKVSQCAICVYPLLLPVVIILFRDILIGAPFIGFFASLFSLLPVVAGFIGGVQYPLATHLVCQFRSMYGKGDVARSAGTLYGIDTLGAAIGALVTGTILIPLFGIYVVVCLCTAINVVVLILLYPARLSPEV